MCLANLALQQTGLSLRLWLRSGARCLTAVRWPDESNTNTDALPVSVYAGTRWCQTLRVARMCANPELSGVALIGLAVASFLWLALTVYKVRIIWWQSPDDHIAWLQKGRPGNWQKVPVYGWFWRRADSVPIRTLWQARILIVVSGLMGLFALLVVVGHAFHTELGIPACHAPSTRQ